MNKKIVICVNTSWNIYNFRLNLARAIKKSGYEVILVAPYDKYSEILKQEFEYHDIYISNKGTNPKEDLKTLIEFYKLYKKIKPDIVLNYTIKPNIYGNIACKLLGINTINNISGLGTVFINENLVTKIAKFLYKFSLKTSSKVFFQNNEDKELFVKNKLISKNKCDVLPGSGVDTDKFSPIVYTKEDKIFRFLLIARILWDKGIAEYVEAAEELKNKYQNIEFQILGSLDAVNKTAVPKEIVDNWVDKKIINYLGTTDNVQDIIKQADCVVLPSYREGTPRTLLESASMAKPIITTNAVGCKDVVDDNINGFLCDVKSIESLKNAMEKMFLLDKNQRDKMGIFGRKKIRREYDEKIVINKYLFEINQF
ncbi:glycosyltransferase family 4 protein [Aliarcobacter butzleri]|uniref:glycosyltransferase family 4 protein n=1 Tax=Aliarcobacter butzleri TaxID=28197 RepID=UPI00263C4D87|nr:glycosyltransferase family 4 protein [Aliarcobacter butzleri]MDN5086602.1 glycosyltransferase family 4 protein [Aliarcobacter butzleri]